MKPYHRIALKYAHDVIDHKIIAGKLTRLACERHIRDIESSQYTFDPKKAAKVCHLIELLPHIKGRWANQKKTIELEPWQIFIVCSIFGWVKSDGTRRYRTAYIEVARKNAKSTLASGIALYMLAFDKEAGAEVYSAATTRQQARIVWEDSKRMVEKSPGLRDIAGLKTSAHAVYSESSMSSFKALTKDTGGNLDGLNIHCAIIDELHGHSTRAVWDVLETGTGAREQPLILAITTAGFNRASICYEQRTYAEKILNRQVTDDTYFAAIYCLDELDDWQDSRNWVKANPNLGVSVSLDDLERKATKARAMAAARNNFLTKHMNVWLNRNISYFDVERWNDLKLDISIDEFVGQDCWIAADLASKTDLACVAILFRDDNDNYTIFVRHYLNEHAIENTTNAAYSGWALESKLIETPGNVTDFSVIEKDILDLYERFGAQEIAFDPFQAAQMIQRLQDKGIDAIAFSQSVANMSGAMKELDALIAGKKIAHDGDPVLSWQIGNVVAHADARDNVYPRKGNINDKIDGVIAMLMCLSRAINSTGNRSSVYDARGIVAF